MFVSPEYGVYVVKPQQFLQELLASNAIPPQYIKQRRYCKKNDSKIPAENALELRLDVGQFEPEEITVKLEKNSLVIVAKHEEGNGELDSFVHYMVRKAQIPEDGDHEGIVSKFSKDGILTVTVPKKVEMKEAERIIPIIRTGEVLRVEAIDKTAEDEEKVIKNDTLETKEEGDESIQANTEEKKLSDDDINTDSDTKSG